MYAVKTASHSNHDNIGEVISEFKSATTEIKRFATDWASTTKETRAQGERNSAKLIELQERLSNVEQQRHVHRDGYAELPQQAKEALTDALMRRQADLQSIKQAPNAIAIDTGISAKAFLGTDLGSAVGAPNIPTTPTRSTTIIDAPVGPSVFDLLPSDRVNTGSYEYVELNRSTSVIGAAVIPSEGALKPQSTYRFDARTALIATVAHTAKISKQALDDVPRLQQFISSRMIQDLRELADKQVLLGSGIAPDLRGLFTAALPVTVPAGSSKANDSIGYAAALMRSQNYTPSMVILSPLDHFAIESERDADGRYVDGPKFYKLTPVQSSVVGIGEAVIVDPRGAVLLEREPVSILLAYSGDDFERNLITVRCEARFGLAIQDQQAIRSVELTP